MFDVGCVGDLQRE